MKLKTNLIYFIVCLSLFAHRTFGAEVSITMDDFDLQDQTMLSAKERNEKTLATLNKFKTKATLFVIGGNIRSEDGMYLSRFDADSLMINKSDGDQVSMIKMKVSELKALAKGQITELLALTADGFWWADGDHIQGGTTVCKVAQATNSQPRR